MAPETEQYQFAKAAVRAKVVIELYDNFPPNPDMLSIRVRRDINGTEYGCEGEIKPYTRLTIGQLLDLSLESIMKETGNATKPSALEEVHPEEKARSQGTTYGCGLGR